MYIQNRIGELLAVQGKTQKWLAEKLDVDKPIVNKYVKNIYQPGKHEQQIAKLLGVGIEGVFYVVSAKGQKYNITPIQK